MRWWDVPFGYRVLAATVFLALVSAIELVLRRRRATRWRGSLFLIGCGAVGAVLGMAVDRFTSSISPLYFVVGKGLQEGRDLPTRILLLGIEAGSCAGVVVGCLYLLAGGPTWFLLRQLHVPVLGALAGGVVTGVVVAGIVEPDSVGRFQLVSAIHMGLYLGGLVGALSGFHRLRRYRRATRCLLPRAPSRASTTLKQRLRDLGRD